MDVKEEMHEKLIFALWALILSFQTTLPWNYRRDETEYDWES